MRVISSHPPSFPNAAWPPGISPAIELHTDGLVLGQGTQLVRLAKRGHLDVEADGDRCLALLAVACNCTVSADVLRHVEAASTHLQRGDRALANLRLIFAGLPKLNHPADAYRLRAAEYVLDKGMSPRALLEELELDASALSLAKFDPAQPRVPAGSGREGGRWTSSSNMPPIDERPSTNDAPPLIPIATTGNFDHACRALGLNPNDASDALHAAKRAHGLGGADNCLFDLDSGEIFYNGESIGNLGD